MWEIQSEATAAFHRFPTRLSMFSKRTWKGRTPRTTVARGAAPGGRQVRGGFPYLPVPAGTSFFRVDLFLLGSLSPTRANVEGVV